MYATGIALLLSLLSLFWGIHPDASHLLFIATGVGALFALLTVIGFSASFNSIQRGEKITARLFEILKRDKRQYLLLVLLLAWPLLSLGTLLFPPYSFALLLIVIGIGSDLLRLFLNNLLNYLNPFSVVTSLENRAFSAINRDQDAELCAYIEALYEVSLKSIQGHTSALANHAIDRLEKISEKFLATIKSPSHPIQSPELESQGVKDTLSYVLVFLLQHLEALHTAALDKKLDLVAGHIINSLTKLATHALNVDLSLVTLPIHYINRCAQNAMQRGFPDVGVKATLGLVEIAKAIPRVKNLPFQDLKTPMTSIILSLDGIAKETFKSNKETKIQLLIEPFQKLQKILAEEPIKSHQDTPLLQQQINRVFEEFRALEAVLNTLPALPNLSEG